VFDKTSQGVVVQVPALTRWLLLSLVAAGLIAGAIMGSVLTAGTSSAQPGRTPEAEQACTPDVMQLCSDYIPDVGPIISCLKRKRLQLSQQCRRFMRPPPKKGHRR
jgi:hypothetical protein